MKCKNCGREISGKALHFSNQIAVKEGCCWFGCLISNFGVEKAFDILQKHLKKKRQDKNSG